MSFGKFEYFDDVLGIDEITPITDKDALIPSDLWDPSYRDTRFTEGTSDGRTIFVDPSVTMNPDRSIGEAGEGLSYDYSDRIHEWKGFGVLREAIDKALEEVGNARSARFAEVMLRHAFNDQTLFLGHMKAGVNRSSGYSYKIYGYRLGDQS